MEEIRAATELPSIRQNVEFTTFDGETLVGELSIPVGENPVATIITLHPLPTAGGFMDSHLLRKMANRFPHLINVAVLRFNTRGTSSPRGTSTGSFDSGVKEEFDVRAAVDYVKSLGLTNIWLVGWSFGTELAIKYGPDNDIAGAVLISPPMRRATEADLARWVEFGKPLVALVPELDDYLRPVEAAKIFSKVPSAQVISGPGEKHLWVGEAATRVALNHIAEAVVPGSRPLPTQA